METGILIKLIFIITLDKFSFFIYVILTEWKNVMTLNHLDVTITVFKMKEMATESMGKEENIQLVHYRKKKMIDHDHNSLATFRYHRLIKDYYIDPQYIVPFHMLVFRFLSL